MCFRYRKWDLGNDIVLIARCEHDAVMYGPNNEVQFINIKSLNEWDSRVMDTLPLVPLAFNSRTDCGPVQTFVYHSMCCIVV